MCLKWLKPQLRLLLLFSLLFATGASAQIVRPQIGPVFPQGYSLNTNFQSDGRDRLVVDITPGHPVLILSWSLGKATIELVGSRHDLAPKVGELLPQITAVAGVSKVVQMRSQYAPDPYAVAAMLDGTPGRYAPPDTFDAYFFTITGGKRTAGDSLQTVPLGKIFQIAQRAFGAFSVQCYGLADSSRTLAVGAYRFNSITDLRPFLLSQTPVSSVTLTAHRSRLFINSLALVAVCLGGWLLVLFKWKAVSRWSSPNLSANAPVDTSYFRIEKRRSLLARGSLGILFLTPFIVFAAIAGPWFHAQIQLWCIDAATVKWLTFSAAGVLLSVLAGLLAWMIILAHRVKPSSWKLAALGLILLQVPCGIAIVDSMVSNPVLTSFNAFDNHRWGMTALFCLPGVLALTILTLDDIQRTKQTLRQMKQDDRSFYLEDIDEIAPGTRINVVWKTGFNGMTCDLKVHQITIGTLYEGLLTHDEIRTLVLGEVIKARRIEGQNNPRILIGMTPAYIVGFVLMQIRSPLQMIMPFCIISFAFLMLALSFERRIRLKALVEQVTDVHSYAALWAKYQYYKVMSKAEEPLSPAEIGYGVWKELLPLQKASHGLKSEITDQEIDRLVQRYAQLAGKWPRPLRVTL